MKRDTAIVPSDHNRPSDQDPNSTEPSISPRTKPETDLPPEWDEVEKFAVSVVNPKRRLPRQADTAGLTSGQTGPYSWVHGLWLYNSDSVDRSLGKLGLFYRIRSLFSSSPQMPITRERVKDYYEDIAKEGAAKWQLDFPRDSVKDIRAIHTEINYAWMDWIWCRDKVTSLREDIRNSRAYKREDPIKAGQDDILFDQCARLIRTRNALTVLEAVYGKINLINAAPPEPEVEEHDWLI